MIKSAIFLVLFLAFQLYSNGQDRNLEPLQILRLHCEKAEDASRTGTNLHQFSWIAASKERGAHQIAYQLEVASTAEKLENGTIDLWNSGRVASGKTLYIPFEGTINLQIPSWYFRVTLWDNHGHSVRSAITSYQPEFAETKVWRAKWIGAGTIHDPLPPKGFFSGAKEEGKSGDSVSHDGRSLLLRRSFQLTRKVRSANVAVTGLGLYELYLNGARIGDQQLSPEKTPYHRQILFDTFDVTNFLKEGKNAVGIHLGNGWYNPYKKWWAEYRMQWFGAKKAIFQLEVQYTDGSKALILSDGTWKTAPGPSLYNCIYDGEIYDANAEWKGWSEADYEDNSWKAAIEVEPPGGSLQEGTLPPVRIVERLSPKQVTEPKSGVKIFDFGQNFAGWTSVAMKGAKGTKLKIRYSEELDAAGNLDVTCNEHAKATAEYILRGEGIEIYEPHFTYFGFQYAEITAEPAMPELLRVEGCVVHSDNQPTGTFSCDNELVNKIHRATVWSQKSNMLGYPMDCPQRDERLGWLGDAQVTAEEALFNFDMKLFYENWFRGIRANQDAATGDIPIISPRPYIRDEGVEWSSSYLTMIWDCYRYYGDLQLITSNYPAMVRYFKFLEGHAAGVIQPKGWIGDWGSRAKGWQEGDPESVPTAYFYLDALLLSRMAGVTGQQQDSIYFANMAEKIRTAYNNRFFHPEKNSYNDGSQMANAFPLYLGLVPMEKRAAVLANLVRQIEVVDSGHLTTGVLGTKYLPEVLSVYGKANVAWMLVNQKGYPSWSEMMKRYNTMCEFWTLKQSHNHVMMGSIDSWFYETLAGIKLVESSPAYGKTIIQPYFAEGLNRVDCSLQTVRGNLSVNWERKNSTLKLKVGIPFNCESEVWIPAGKGFTVMESGAPVSTKKEITLIKTTGDFNVYRIGSGSYRFEVKYPAGKF